MAAIIVGGGYSGLLAARTLLADSRFSGEIYLLEHSHTWGGLLGSTEHKEGGIFDHGFHVLQDTEISFLNKIMRSVLPDSAWLVKRGTEQEIRGLFAQGALQSSSPYCDLRSFTSTVQAAARADFYHNISQQSRKEFVGKLAVPPSAYAYLQQRFGEYIAKNILQAPLSKLFGKEASALHPYCCRLLPLDRIGLFSNAEITSLPLAYQAYVLATSETGLPPAHLAATRDRYYPHRYGMKFMIEAMLGQFPSQRVKLLSNTRVTQIHQHPSRGVDAIELAQPGHKTMLTNVDLLIWTGGIAPLARLLKVEAAQQFELEQGPRTTIVNLLFDRPDTLQGLCYAYCYEEDFTSFRLCSPANLCPDAVRRGLYPFTVETIQGVSAAQPTSPAALIKQVVAEAKQLGALHPSSQLRWAEVLPLGTGYPLPSLENIEAICQLRREVEALELSNLLMVGAMARDNLFFQNDVFTHCYQQVDNFMSFTKGRS